MNGAILLPSNFKKQPMDSISQNSETETIARNIMVILSRTGNTFRFLGWEEYKAERLKDGNFTESEQPYFENTINYCYSPQTALIFCRSWGS